MVRRNELIWQVISVFFVGFERHVLKTNNATFCGSRGAGCASMCMRRKYRRNSTI